MSFRRTVMGMAALAIALPSSAAHAQQGTASAVSVKVLPPLYDQPLRYVLSEPAYVAAFIVSPGEGVRMIYPLTATQEKLRWAGFHSDPLIGLHFDDDAYDVVLGHSAWSYASYGAGYAQGPRYLYVVASRWPLDVSQFVHRPMALQRTIGYESARSFDSEDAFNALLNNVVSLGSQDSWDSDVYMLWAPEWMDVGPHSLQEALYYNMRTRVIACQDGSSRVVPLNWIFSGCNGEGRLVLLRPVVSKAQRLASDAAPPTVLPTIRGVRMQGSAPSKAEPASNGFLTTAAGGVTSDGVRLVDRPDRPARTLVYTTDDAGVVVIDRGQTRRQREDGGRDGWRAARRERPENEGAPRLAPNPALPPNPHLAPAPIGYTRMNVTPAPRTEPRMETPRAEPRMAAPVTSTPRAAPPAPAPASTPAARASTSKVQ